MKQKATKFEKVSSRQFAYLFLGVGSIGLALTVGGPDLGINLGAAAAGIMLGGFALATVFLFLAGGAPVAIGVEEYEVDERIQVVMSDDLNNEIKAKVEKAVTDITKNHEAALVKFAQSAEEFTAKVTKLEATLDKANVAGVADQLSKLTGAIDLEATSEALGSLKGSMSSLLSNLDDLSNLSSNSTSKLETLISEVSEDLSATRNGLKEKSKGISSELDSTLKALSAFNRL
jgi:hypothetical protein